MAADDHAARLDLIRLAASASIGSNVTHPERYVGLVQTLCDRRDVPVRDLVTPAAVRLVRGQSAEAFDDLADLHGWSVA